MHWCLWCKISASCCLFLILEFKPIWSLSSTTISFPATIYSYLKFIPYISIQFLHSFLFGSSAFPLSTSTFIFCALDSFVICFLPCWFKEVNDVIKFSLFYCSTLELLTNIGWVFFYCDKFWSFAIEFWIFCLVETRKWRVSLFDWFVFYDIILE